MRFRNEYYFLSNMYSSPIVLKIQIKDQVFTADFPTVENAFQALKCPERFREFQHIKPQEAKRLGRKIALRPDWESVKDGFMERLIRMKFRQNPDLKEKLKRIPGHIQEDNTWNDRYWGVCNGIGENRLGKILMKVRDELQAEA